MTSWRRRIGFGLLMWVVPFVVAFAVFPVHETNRPLFESVMAVAVTATAALLALFHLRHIPARRRREGLVVGILWFAICVVVDAPLMLLGGPMHMSIGAYLADIGLTYLCIPVVTVAIGGAYDRGVTTVARAPHR